MKTLKHVFLLAIIAVAMIACNNEKETVETTDADTTTNENSHDGEHIKMNADQSTLWYEGGKVVGNSTHNGSVNFKNGHFVVNDSKLVGGEFIVDMTSIENKDISDDDKKQQFENHMRTDDFFDVENHPEAKFTILEIEHPADGESADHTITGNLTIKSTTKTITFPATVTVNGDDVSLEADFNIDRTDFGVEFRSSLTDVAKDKLIKDAIELKVKATS